MPPVAKKKPKPSSKPQKKKVEKAPVDSQTSSGEIVGLFADELQEVYALFGHELDRENAKDKAIFLVREMLYGRSGVKTIRAKDHEFSKVPLCKEHRED
jgi:hypothetical protein